MNCILYVTRILSIVVLAHTSFASDIPEDNRPNKSRRVSTNNRLQVSTANHSSLRECAWIGEHHRGTRDVLIHWFGFHIDDPSFFGNLKKTSKGSRAMAIAAQQLRKKPDAVGLFLYDNLPWIHADMPVVLDLKLGKSPLTADDLLRVVPGRDQDTLSDKICNVLNKRPDLCVQTYIAFLPLLMQASRQEFDWSKLRRLQDGFGPWSIFLQAMNRKNSQPVTAQELINSIRLIKFRYDRLPQSIDVLIDPFLDELNNLCDHSLSLLLGCILQKTDLTLPRENSVFASMFELNSSIHRIGEITYDDRVKLLYHYGYGLVQSKMMVLLETFIQSDYIKEVIDGKNFGNNYFKHLALENFLLKISPSEATMFMLRFAKISPAFSESSSQSLILSQWKQSPFMTAQDRIYWNEFVDTTHKNLIKSKYSSNGLYVSINNFLIVKFLEKYEPGDTSTNNFVLKLFNLIAEVKSYACGINFQEKGKNFSTWIPFLIDNVRHKSFVIIEYLYTGPRSFNPDIFSKHLNSFSESERHMAKLHENGNHLAKYIKYEKQLVKLLKIKCGKSLFFHPSHLDSKGNTYAHVFAANMHTGDSQRLKKFFEIILPMMSKDDVCHRNNHGKTALDLLNERHPKGSVYDEIRQLLKKHMDK